MNKVLLIVVCLGLISFGTGFMSSSIMSSESPSGISPGIMASSESPSISKGPLVSDSPQISFFSNESESQLVIPHTDFPSRSASPSYKVTLTKNPIVVEGDLIVTELSSFTNSSDVTFTGDLVASSQSKLMVYYGQIIRVENATFAGTLIFNLTMDSFAGDHIQDNSTIIEYEDYNGKFDQIQVIDDPKYSHCETSTEPDYGASLLILTTTRNCPQDDDNKTLTSGKIAAIVICSILGIAILTILIVGTIMLTIFLLKTYSSHKSDTDNSLV